MELWSFGALERKEVTIFFYISKINWCTIFCPKPSLFQKKKPPHNEGAFLLVPKHQSVAELVDDDRFLPIHLVGENLT